LDVFTQERVLTIAAFVAALVVLWVVVRLNRDGLASRIKAGRRIEIASAANLGNEAQAVLLTVDGERLFIVSQRKAGVAIHPMGTAAAAVDAPESSDILTPEGTD